MTSSELGMPYTGERFVPEAEGVVALEHLHRYLQASELSDGKDVLDLASGEGYGSALLSKRARTVTGVDISSEAVEHARRRYGRDNLNYLQGNCADIPLADASVDLVVSFETIEHHDEHEKMMDEILRVLRPEGMLIISSPDKLNYSDVPNYSNPYHVKELYRHEFEALLTSRFSHVAMSGQRVQYGSSIFAETVVGNPDSYWIEDGVYKRAQGVVNPIYLIAWASNVALPPMSSGILEQEIEDCEAVNAWREKYSLCERELQNVGKVLEENDSKIHDLYRQVGERDRRIASLYEILESRNNQVALLDRQLEAVFSSRTYRWTKPLRILKNNLWLSKDSASRAIIAKAGHGVWHLLPASESLRLRVKGAVFSSVPLVFRHTAAYQRWVSFVALQGPEGLPTTDSESDQLANTYVPLLAADPVQNKPVKLICFYLPQYHPIPENNQWWGDGFTEWTNVTPAQPQFEGHYQPHVPGELGYYSLLDAGVQRRQVELAKLYGIEGFCFYFYWFAGKRLLEQPIQNYLGDPSLDLPFCLCWANENWSRRWDGLDSEILIAQQHTLDDDLAFIKHLAQYLRDSRYIRIDGKPLLLVYRPGELPNPKVTAELWRNWCRENDIGEIYLAYTQSFESVNPSVYGFDAAIEFPPNNSALSNVTEQLTPIVDDFDSAAYDWRELVERSKRYTKPGYTLFRGVNPSWDNTARRKKGASVLLNSSPVGYQEWLQNAIADTVDRFENPDERLVFVNAWNEWAEGAHLEPDQRYGYAYLEATRVALGRNAPCPAKITDTIAIVVHAFYEDVFAEIIERLRSVKRVPFKLFVTTPHDLRERVDSILREGGFSYELLAVNNRGRDILPFLKAAQLAVSGGYAYLLKIHTKKSTHRADGGAWRNDLFDKLLSESSISTALSRFEHDRGIGLIGPAGHIVSMNTYWGSNRHVVVSLAHRLGQSVHAVRDLNFVAGSMFFARTEALTPLLNLAIGESDFEPEQGQVDGTLAHALERAISISARTMGLEIVSTDGKHAEDSGRNYGYADKTL